MNSSIRISDNYHGREESYFGFRTEAQDVGLQGFFNMLNAMRAELQGSVFPSHT